MSLLVDYINSLSQVEKQLIQTCSELMPKLDNPSININWAVLLNGHVFPAEPMLCTVWSCHHPENQIAFSLLGPVNVSTVFLAGALGFNNNNPQHFETMVFLAGAESYSRRYSTYQEAIQGHYEISSRIGHRESITQEEIEEAMGIPIASSIITHES